MTSDNWRPFYFESNKCHGWIHSSHEWEKVKEYHDLYYLKKAKKWHRTHNTLLNYPYFGYTLKCQGEETLFDFFVNHEMEM